MEDAISIMRPRHETTDPPGDAAVGGRSVMDLTMAAYDEHQRSLASYAY